jgi:predicted nucleic acid-binding protein
MVRIYIDNSVIGGYFDTEFEEHTKCLFERTDFKFVISDITEQELVYAPQNVKNLLIDLKLDVEFLKSGKEAKFLANEYIASNAIGQKHLNDCLHIATATVARVDVLASWNFKHIVNTWRIREYNLINIKYGYGALDIRTPREVL